MIRAVVFDVGGTLHTSQPSPTMQEDFSNKVIKTLAGADIHLKATASELFGPLAKRAEEYKLQSEQSGRELPTAQIWGDYFLRPFNLDRDKLAAVSEELSFLYDYDRVLHTPRPHMKETVEELRRQGLVTGVISNIISLTFVPTILKQYGLEEMMSCVVTSSETGIRKPEADIFRITEERLGMKPQELAYVGDTISRDVIGTRNAGWRLIIQIRNPAISFRDKKVIDSGYSPDYLISDLAEIPAIIRQENKTN